jgi:hypothetical protein
MPLLPNSDSIQFLVLIPHMYVYTMAYYDTSPFKDIHQKIRDSIKHSIMNIVKALNETPYQEI